MPFTDSILNPETGRTVKVGSATYKKLLAAGSIKPREIVVIEGKKMIEVSTSAEVNPKPTINQDEKMKLLREKKAEKKAQKLQVKEKVDMESKYKKKYEELLAKMGDVDTTGDAN